MLGSAEATPPRARLAARETLAPLRDRLDALAPQAAAQLRPLLLFLLGEEAEARRAIFVWINRYNSRRRHSTLGYIAPITWEHQYHQPKANPAA